MTSDSVCLSHQPVWLHTGASGGYISMTCQRQHAGDTWCKDLAFHHQIRSWREKAEALISAVASPEVRGGGLAF